MECIDTGCGLELWQHGDVYEVRLEDDNTTSATLSFAHWEGFCEDDFNEAHWFSPSQIAQIEAWFEEYEG